jgi:hypothetical protein
MHWQCDSMFMLYHQQNDTCIAAVLCTLNLRVRSRQLAWASGRQNCAENTLELRQQPVRQSLCWQQTHVGNSLPCCCCCYCCCRCANHFTKLYGLSIACSMTCSNSSCALADDSQLCCLSRNSPEPGRLPYSTGAPSSMGMDVSVTSKHPK